MVVVHVCIGSSCHVKGAYDVIKGLQSLIEEKNLKDVVELRGAFCIGQCTKAVSVRIENEEEVYSVHSDNLKEFFNEQVMKRL